MVTKHKRTHLKSNTLKRLLLWSSVALTIILLTVIWLEPAGAYGGKSVHVEIGYKALGGRPGEERFGGFPLVNIGTTYDGGGTPDAWTVAFSIEHGEYDEDCEDVIWDECNQHSLNCSERMCPTINHFWNADGGPWDPVQQGGTSCPDCCYLNAWTKADILMARAIYWVRNGRWDHGDWNFRSFAYETLGRVAHLLQDMSVPAHVHEDFHPTRDDYEDAMSDDAWDNHFYWFYDDPIVVANLPPGATTPTGLIEIPEDVCTQIWEKDSWNDIWDRLDEVRVYLGDPRLNTNPPCPTCGAITYINSQAVNPCSNTYGVGLAKLAYLMYTTNQYADWFGSQDEDGNNNVYYFMSWIDYSEFDNLGIGRDPHVAIMGHYLYRYAMRATATLFKVFVEMFDFTAPSLQYNITGGTVGNNGWYTSPVVGEVTVEELDDWHELPSGLNTFEYKMTGITSWTSTTLNNTYAKWKLEFEQQFSNDGTWEMAVTDLVDNRSTACQIYQPGGPGITFTPCQIKIDQTPPTLVIDDPEARDYTRSEGFTVTWTATDATSGLASEAAMLDGSSVTNGQHFDLAAFSPGAHTLRVTAIDNAGNTTSESVTLQVILVPPLAENDVYAATGGKTLNVAAPGVLGNDTDLNLYPMTAVLVSGPANGVLALNPDGSFTYTPDPFYMGADSFTYRADDGALVSNTATVTLDVHQGGELACGGGTVRVGDVLINIPLTGFPGCAYVNIVPALGDAGPDEPDGLLPLGHRFDIRVRRTDGKYLTSFDPPLQVCYLYSDDDLQKVSGDPLQFQIWTSGGLNWQLLYLNKLDEENRMVCAPVSHLSYFDLFMGAQLPATGFAPGKVTQLSLQLEDKAYEEMGEMWLEIPRLGVQATIVGVPVSGGGWDVTWLGNQAGWLEGTAFPTWAGNSSLSAHVYDAYGQPGPFEHLNWLWYGDEVIIHAWGQEYVYAVRSAQTVSAETLAPVLKHEEYAWLTLITCRGYDESSDTYKYRVVVRAVQVEIR